MLSALKKIALLTPVTAEEADEKSFSHQSAETNISPLKTPVVEPTKVNLNYTNYTKGKGRYHFYNEVQSLKKFAADKKLQSKYKGLKGDQLKSVILDGFKDRINRVTTRQEFLNLQDDLLKEDNLETNVLRQAQGAISSFLLR